MVMNIKGGFIMANTNTNDERIIKLKEQIADKRKSLKDKNIKFIPVTNCLLELDGIKYNLHVVTNPLLLLKLESLWMAAQNLGISAEDVIIGGYSITDWIKDVQTVLAIQNYKTEKQKLDRLEKQLTNLLSNDKQTELMIDELASMLE